MATEGAIIIEDETGIVQLAGTATFPDGLTISDVETPDVASGDSAPITIKTGDAPAGDAGDITIRGGDGDAGGGVGGSVILQPGDGNTKGGVSLRDAAGNPIVAVLGGGALQFFGTNGDPQDTITGALSAVTDAAAKDVLTSLLTALSGYGLVLDGTT